MRRNHFYNSSINNRQYSIFNSILIAMNSSINNRQYSIFNSILIAMNVGIVILVVFPQSFFVLPNLMY